MHVRYRDWSGIFEENHSLAARAFDGDLRGQRFLN